MKVINDLLDPEILILRNWGEEGIDYMVDDNGEFYRTEEQRENSLDNKWVLNNMCYYQYLPMYKGMLDDGINAVVPWEQSREFYENLGSNDRELFRGIWI